MSNGGSAPSAATLTAVANYWCSMINAGITNKIIAVNVFAPDNLTAALTPLYAIAGGPIWTNHNFVGGDLTVNGLKGDGSSKYLDSAIVPFSSAPPAVTAFVSTNAAGISGYFYTAGAQAAQVEIGVYNSVTSVIALNANNNGDINWECWDTGTTIIAVANGGFQGYLSGNRTANAVSTLYKASSTVSFTPVSTNTVASTGTRPADTKIFLFTLDNGGTPFAYSTNRISYVSFTTGLTASEAQAEYNAVQALRVSFGGGYR